jgi:4a-hydroxytetrahydrobiopterin dehydratase
MAVLNIPRVTLKGVALKKAVALMKPWYLNDAKHLAREYRFKSFSEAWGFMSRVALLAEKMDHHPIWSNEYNIVKVELYTQDKNAITMWDIDMAHTMEKLAKKAAEE